jgi:hypothetical protein
MMSAGDVPREQQAAEAHAAHERAEQHTEGDGRRSNHQLEQLEPHNFVNECGAAAANEQQ